jgi:hypothetical protein
MRTAVGLMSSLLRRDAPVATGQFVELGVEWIWLGLESGSPPGRPFAAVERAP